MEPKLYLIAILITVTTAACICIVLTIATIIILGANLPAAVVAMVVVAAAAVFTVSMTSFLAQLSPFLARSTLVESYFPYQ